MKESENISSVISHTGFYELLILWKGSYIEDYNMKHVAKNVDQFRVACLGRIAYNSQILAFFCKVIFQNLHFWTKVNIFAKRRGISRMLQPFPEQKKINMFLLQVF